MSHVTYLSVFTEVTKVGHLTLGPQLVQKSKPEAFAHECVPTPADSTASPLECEMYFRVPITQKTNHLYIAITCHNHFRNALLVTYPSFHLTL